MEVEAEDSCVCDGGVVLWFGLALTACVCVSPRLSLSVSVLAWRFAAVARLDFRLCRLAMVLVAVDGVAGGVGVAGGGGSEIGIVILCGTVVTSV